MGLDVYLYEFDDRETTLRLESEYEKRSEEIWHFGGRKYEQITEAEKEQARATLKEVETSLGLGECGSDDARKRKIEQDWPGAPDHYFKVGYFRSSYNEGGINSVLRRRSLPELDEICGKPEGSDDDFQPDWKAVKARAVAVREKYIAAIREFPYDVFCVDNFHHTSVPSDERGALEAFREERKRGGSFECYSNAIGMFWRADFPRVQAIINGKKYGRPCVYVVQSLDVSGKDGPMWYATALDIVAATADFVLSQPDPRKFWLSWSG